jgi:hypothetical protein
MFKLDNAFLESLGLGALPVEEKNRLLQMIYERLEMNVGMRLAEKMTDQQLDEFEGFIDRNDEPGALKWLESNFPNYKDVVAEELEKLKGEVKTAAPQILSAHQQGGQQSMQQPQAQPQSQQPYMPPQAPMPQQGAAYGQQPYQPPAPMQQPYPQPGYQPQTPPQPMQQPYGPAPQPMPMTPQQPQPQDSNQPAQPQQPFAAPQPPQGQPQQQNPNSQQFTPPPPGYMPGQ